MYTYKCKEKCVAHMIVTGFIWSFKGFFQFIWPVMFFTGSIAFACYTAYDWLKNYRVKVAMYRNLWLRSHVFMRVKYYASLFFTPSKFRGSLTSVNSVCLIVLILGIV